MTTAFSRLLRKCWDPREVREKDRYPPRLATACSVVFGLLQVRQIIAHHASSLRVCLFHLHSRCACVLVARVLLGMANPMSSALRDAALPWDSSSRHSRCACVLVARVLLGMANPMSSALRDAVLPWDSSSHHRRHSRCACVLVACVLLGMVTSMSSAPRHAATTESELS